MRTRRGFRVVLNGHRPLGWPDHASTGAIVQVDVGHLHTFRERLGVHCIVVVLCANLDAACMALKADQAVFPGAALWNLHGRRQAGRLIATAGTEHCN